MLIIPHFVNGIERCGLDNAAWIVGICDSYSCNGQESIS